jgi:hypothetical protein
MESSQPCPIIYLFLKLELTSFSGPPFPSRDSQGINPVESMPGVLKGLKIRAQVA